MATVSISRQQARQVYPTAPDSFKSFLEKSFGKDSFLKTPFEQITSFEAACEDLGVDPNDTKFKTGDPDDIAYQRCKAIIKALNPEGWEADHNDPSQQKWYVIFIKDSSGFRFDFAYYVCTRTGVGARLYFENRERALHFATTFAGEAEPFFTNKK